RRVLFRSNEPQRSVRGSLITLYNDVLATLDSLAAIKNIDLEEASSLKKQIKQILQNENSNDDQLRRAEMLIQELKKRINYFGSFQHTFKEDPIMFIGTKTFCDGLQVWKYEVITKGDSVTLKLFPDLKNNNYKNKGMPIETINGIIKNGKIITKDGPDEFKYENGILYELNNEGDYNDFPACK